MRQNIFRANYRDKRRLFQAETFQIKAPFYNIIKVNNPYELISGAGI